MKAPDKIVAHRDIQTDPLHVFVHWTRRAQRRQGAVSAQIAEDPVVQARINHGRWVADCPFCGGAESVDLADLRFWCLSCDMEDSGRRWLRVVMPAQRAQVEAELLKRPNMPHRNWQPGESVAKLRRENAKHLAGVK